MQFFGKFKELHELEYLVKSYLYIPFEDEKIDSQKLQLLLKKKNKNVAGTFFLYNPFTVPLGYDKNEKLLSQGFLFEDNFFELEIEDSVRVLAKALKKNYKGKLIEIKYLFNYNKENIQPTSALEVFDMDLEKLHTNQLTVFSKKYNYHEVKNISYNGKFIFFAWGHKFEKSHLNISIYASNIAQWATKIDKQIGFIYDGTMDEEGSFEYNRFYHLVQFGKLKTTIPNTLEQIFSKEVIKPFQIQTS